MDLTQILIIFAIAALIVTYWLKRKGYETYYIITLLRTRKYLPLLDKFSHFKWLNSFANIGIMLGFGAFGIDYLYGSKIKSNVKRLALFLASALVLAVIFYYTVGLMVISNPLTSHYIYFFCASFGLMGFAGFALAALVTQAIDIIEKLLLGKKACPGVAPVIPGLEIPGVPIVVPLHAWISLLIILLVHEGMHGVMARKAKIKIKSAGLLLLGFLPIGAFVEPEEAELKRAEKIKQLRLYAAGPMGNLAVFLLAILFMGILSAALFTPIVMPHYRELRLEAVDYLAVESVDQNSEFCGDVYPNSAHGIIEPGMKIWQVNGKNVRTVQDFFESGLQSTDDLTLLLEREDGTTFEETFERNKLGMIGITVREVEKPGFAYELGDFIFILLLGLFASFMNWFIILNFLVAVLNFLPTKPFDGGPIAKTIFSRYLGFTKWTQAEKEGKVSKFFIYLIVGLLLLNALPLFLL